MNKVEKIKNIPCLICEEDKIHYTKGEGTLYMELICDDCRKALQKLIKQVK